VQRFLREARAAGRLNHPNIVSAIDVGEDQGFYYFAMEYVEGEPLSDVLRREGPLPVDRAVAIATEVARALDHAVDKELIHRDIKPANLMITPDGKVRVTDFGLARALDPDQTDLDPDRFMGTPAYVAPEQIRAEDDIDCRADIFALGVTLFEALTGDLPFQGANPMAVAASVLTDPLPAIRKRRPEVPAAVEKIVTRMTAKDRDERYATPADVVAALEQVAKTPRGRAGAAPRRAARKKARGGERPRPRPPARASSARRLPRRRRSSTGVVLAVAALVAALGVLGVVLITSRREGGERAVVAPKTSAPATPTAVEAAGQAAAKRLRQAAAQAEQQAEAHPEAYASRIARLRRIRDQFAKARFQMPQDAAALYEQVIEKLQTVEGKAEKATQAELARRRREADAALEAGKLGAALAAADQFPDELVIPPLETEVTRFRQTVRRQVRERFETLDREGRRLMKSGELSEAREVYAALEGCGLPEAERRATQALAEIDRRLAARDEKAQRLAREAYPLTAQAVLDRLAARRYDDARALLDAAIVEPQLAPVSQRLRRMRPLVRAAAEVWGHAVGALRRLDAGETVRVAGVGGEFVRYRNGKIHLRASAVTVARPVSELRPGEAVAFARKRLGSSAERQVRIALFLLAERDYDAARAALAAAKEKGADVEAAADLLRRFAPRTCERCDGEGTVPCAACGGKGYTGTVKRPCDACGGQGKFDCPRCNAQGWVSCPTCNGTGEEFKGLACQTCGGRGKIRCPRCKGAKQMACKKCRGTGVLTRPEVCEECQGARIVPCPACGGRGTFPAPDLVPAGAAEQ
ncbi:MAG: protein kinase domain-containing protein, partial [bacterium]